MRQPERVKTLEPIAHRLEEGHLQSALDCSWHAGHQLWETPCTRTPQQPDQPLRPSELYPLTSTPNWTFDRGLSESLAEVYAMHHPEQFARKYMSLRPDFRVETAEKCKNFKQGSETAGERRRFLSRGAKADRNCLRRRGY